MSHAPSPKLPPLRDIIRRYDLGARKSLGQHFLLDQNLTDRIVRAAGNLRGRTVIEVGPGPGGLTRSLLASDAATVITVEKDARCIEALGELFDVYGDRLRIHQGDALSLRISDLFEAAKTPPPLIIANLPYNISTALLIHWLHEIAERPETLGRMVLMFQKEVAERLTASPGNKQYGRLSILTAWLCDCRPLFDIPKQAFTPPPKVTSTVVELIPRDQPLSPASLPTLEKVTAAAFGQRRKMLRQSLKSLGDCQGLLESTGIEGTQRAEDLTVAQFCDLAICLQKRSNGK